MPFCTIISCGNNSNKNNLQNGGVSYHRFPQDGNYKEKWVDTTGRFDWVPNKQSTICSDHFSKEDFMISDKGRRFLKPNSVPTINILTFHAQKRKASEKAHEVEQTPSKTSKLNETASVFSMSESDLLKRRLRYSQNKARQQKIKIKRLQRQNLRMKRKINSLENVLKSLQEKFDMNQENITCLKNTNLQSKMSGEPEVVQTPEEEEEEIKTTYKPPPEKTIEEILAADQEDESLRKYKEALLGQAQMGTVIVDVNDPRRVIVKKLALCVQGRDDLELDLSGDLTDLKKQVFIIKEGVQYKIRIDFIVQREIVHGLKYVQKTYRLGVPVDKMTHMVGSYPPKTEIQSYTTPPEDAPSGLMTRGTYSVNSLFTDDDKNIHLQWEWAFEIKKDWKD